MMEQLRPNEAYRSMVTSSFSGKKVKSLVFPALNWPYVGLELQYLGLFDETGSQQVSGGFPTSVQILMDHTALILCYSKTSLAFFWLKLLNWHFCFIDLGLKPLGSQSCKRVKGQASFLFLKSLQFHNGLK